MLLYGRLSFRVVCRERAGESAAVQIILIQFMMRAAREVLSPGVGVYNIYWMRFSVVEKCGIHSFVALE